MAINAAQNQASLCGPKVIHGFETYLNYALVDHTTHLRNALVDHPTPRNQRSKNSFTPLPVQSSRGFLLCQSIRPPPQNAVQKEPTPAMHLKSPFQPCIQPTRYASQKSPFQPCNTTHEDKTLCSQANHIQPDQYPHSEADQ